MMTPRMVSLVAGCSRRSSSSRAPSLMTPRMVRGPRPWQRWPGDRTSRLRRIAVGLARNGRTDDAMTAAGRPFGDPPTHLLHAPVPGPRGQASGRRSDGQAIASDAGSDHGTVMWMRRTGDRPIGRLCTRWMAIPAGRVPFPHCPSPTSTVRDPRRSMDGIGSGCHRTRPAVTVRRRRSATPATRRGSEMRSGGSGISSGAPVSAISISGCMSSASVEPLMVEGVSP